MTEMRCFQINGSFWKGQLSVNLTHNLFYKMILYCITQVCRASHVQRIRCSYTPTFKKRRNQAGSAGKWMKIYLNYQQIELYIYIFLVKTKHKHKDARILSSSHGGSSPGIGSPRLGQQKVTEELAEKKHEEVVRKTPRKNNSIRYRFGDFRKV